MEKHSAGPLESKGKVYITTRNASGPGKYPCSGRPSPLKQPRGTGTAASPGLTATGNCWYRGASPGGAAGTSMSLDVPGTCGPSQWRSAREPRCSWGTTDEEVPSPGTRRCNSRQGFHGRNGIPAEKPSLSRLLVCARRVEHRERLAEPCDSQGPPAQGPGYGRV